MRTEPCVAESDEIPPLFYCAYTVEGVAAFYSKAVRAVREIDTFSGINLGITVTVPCEVPSMEWLDQFDALSESVKLSIYYFAVPPSVDAILLPFKGAPGANSIMFAGRPPPLLPPAPPASPPPSYTECHELKLNVPSAETGEYVISPGGFGTQTYTVFCDMDADNGHGYTVIARFGAGTGSSPAWGQTGGGNSKEYWTTAAIGFADGSRAIDNKADNSVFDGPNGYKQMKMEDTLVDSIMRQIGPDHKFKWYTRGEACSDANCVGGNHRTGYSYSQVDLDSSSYTTTDVMKQRCRGKDMAESNVKSDTWSNWYTPTGDYGLTIRGYNDESLNGYYVCYYDGRSCGNSYSGCSSNGADNGYFITRHALYEPGYYDVCGRGDSCSSTRHVVILLG